jgi:phenylacetate-CoA ligase
MLATIELLREAALPYRLAQVLPRWLKEVPLYQRSDPERRLGGASVSLTELRQLPLITKYDIRHDFPRNFLRADANLGTLLAQDLVELEHTSGTSEERTPLLLGRGWWAEQENRALRLNPFVAAVLDEFPEARRVTINSPVCSGDICYTGVPSRNDRIVGNALFVSLSRFPFLWSEADLQRMAAEAADWQPQFLDVDPVYGVVFAGYCERHSLRLPSLRFILCSYEFVSVTHRRVLERVFGVPVFNLYGSTETGHLLMEGSANISVRPAMSSQTPRTKLPAPGCEMLPSFETAFLEVLNTDSKGVSELVVTTLTNDFMPLIRYRIGDLLERHEQPYRTSFVLHGRVADAFTGPDGGRVTTLQIDQCFAGLPGIAHYQLTERSGGDWLLRFVPDTHASGPADLDELRHRLTQQLGAGCRLAIEPTDLVLPESSGKFRLGYPARRPPGE